MNLLSGWGLWRLDKGGPGGGAVLDSVLALESEATRLAVLTLLPITPRGDRTVGEERPPGRQGGRLPGRGAGTNQVCPQDVLHPRGSGFLRSEAFPERLRCVCSGRRRRPLTEAESCPRCWLRGGCAHRSQTWEGPQSLFPRALVCAGSRQGGYGAEACESPGEAGLGDAGRGSEPRLGEGVHRGPAGQAPGGLRCPRFGATAQRGAF